MGHKKDLEISDLYQILPEDSSKTLGETLERAWIKELEMGAKDTKEINRVLFHTIRRCFGWEFMKLGCLVFIEECGLRLIQPMCLGLLVRSFQPDTTIQRWEAYLYATGVVASYFFLMFTNHPYYHGVLHMSMKLRVAACSLINKKSLKLSRNALGQTTVGQMVNLLSNDVNRFDMSIQLFHYLWIGPVQTVITLGLLWCELGPSCLAGLILLVLFVPFQVWIGKIFAEMRLKTATETDERIRVMNEIISGMRVIKMYTWEKPFANLIDLCRKKEMDIIRKTSYYRALNMSLFFTSTRVILFVTFLIYVFTGNILTAEKVFVTLALYNNIRRNMTLYFPFGVSFAAETLVSIERIEKFLLLDEKETAAKFIGSQPSQDGGITLTNVSAKWLKEANEPTLSSISCSVKPGQLLAVVGAVGSGKTSLLHLMLREIQLTGGELSVNGKMAYASQEPWVFSGTVRQNILCGQSFDAKRFQQVIKVCALSKDLNLLPHGDKTLVGEKGVILSGGQKARVNLARALYLDADVYLLDDPLSAVDTHVGRHLFNRSIMGFLKGKVRVLVTHQLQYLKEADQILVLKDGRKEVMGTFAELQTQGINFTKLIAKNEEVAEERAVEANWNRTSSETQVSFRSRLSSSESHHSVASSGEVQVKDISTYCNEQNSESLNFSKKSVPVQKEEIRSKGTVSRNVYLDYFAAGGGHVLAAVLVVLNLITQICFSGSDYWLNIWTNNEERRSMREDVLTKLSSISHGLSPINDTMLVPDTEFTSSGFLQNLETNTGVYIYTGIIGALFVFSMLRTVIFFMVCIKSSFQLHNSMFNAVIRSPVRFFDSNPIGRTLNRFAKDVGTMDEMLPWTSFDVTMAFFSMLGICTVVGVVNPWLLLPCGILAAIFYYLWSFYMATARDIKRLEGVTCSPVYSHLSATLLGLTTIRAHGVEELFQAEFELHQDLHSSAWYLFLSTGSWFALWLDWLCVAFLACVTYGCLIMSEMTTSSDAGLIISSVIGMMGNFQWGVRQSAEMENQMTSVERIMEYSKLPSEAPLESASDKKPPADWPTHGTIMFENMSLRYSKSDAAVLRNITCTICHKEKVGIVGRTGAGKSSLITALFRMTEPDGVIRIDGVNIKEIGLHDLRSRLSIIPQDPVLFNETLRKNLDPFGKYGDDSLWKVLKQVKLKAFVTDLPRGLEYVLAEGGSNFSVGQRQLVCLARAILRRNRILVLDEATANVDPKTDELIQETIRLKFQHCTVLTIAHRLNTIMDSDRVMVMDAGLLKEFDEPSVLLAMETSLFKSLVEQTGLDEARHLKEIAKQAAIKRNSTRNSIFLTNNTVNEAPHDKFPASSSAFFKESNEFRAQVKSSEAPKEAENEMTVL